MTGVAGTPVRKGAPSQWYASSTRMPGYVVDQAYWRSLPGTYRAFFKLSVAAGDYAHAELWDSTTGTLLGRLTVKPTHGPRIFSLNGRLRHTIGQPAIGGHALWAIKPQTLPGDDLELRVWSPGGASRVRVYYVALEQLTGAHYHSAASTAQQQLDLGEPELAPRRELEQGAPPGAGDRVSA